MKEKFTLGPWDVYTGDDKSIRIATDERRICDIAIYIDDIDEANARLIAAAPDMYEALKEALMVIDQSEHALGIERDAVDAIKRALAKADCTP